MSAVIGTNNVGTSGSDTFQGGIGDDTYAGLGGPDLIRGGGGDDVLEGDAGNDTLYGESGFNYMQGGTGDDLLIGGSWASVGYYSAVSGVTVDLRNAGPQSVGGGAGIDTLVDIDAVAGSPFNDTLTGNNGDNNIAGGGGNDLLNGQGGYDSVDYYGASSGVTVNLNVAGPQNVGTGEGVDTIINFEAVLGSFHADTLIGTPGDNRFSTRGGGDFIDGGTGFDTADFRDLSGSVNANLNLPGGNAISVNGADTLIGIEGLVGTRFNDTFIGTGLNNTFMGGPGDDYIDAGGGDDAVDFYDALNGVFVDLLKTGPQALGQDQGTDTILNVENIFASLHADTLMGTDGHNYFNTRGGGDFVDGRAGYDTVDFRDINSGVNANLSAVGPNAISVAGTDTLVSVEALKGTMFADTLAGDAYGNTLYGGLGDDLLDGGGGFDSVDYYEAAGGVTVNLNLSSAQSVGAGQGVDTLANFEGVLGSFFADVLTGTTDNNYFNTRGGGDLVIAGGGFDTVDFRDLAGGVNANLFLSRANSIGGADTLIGVEALTGSNFNDTLTGDAGANILSGRGGDDLIDGGLGADTATYVDAIAGVRVNLSVSGPQAVGADQGLDTLVAIEGLTGGRFADTLTGDGNSNFLDGGLGDDSLSGLGGEDQLRGGLDNDLMDGGAGVDSAYYSTASGGVKIDLTVVGWQAIGSDQGSDLLTNIEQIVGSNFADTLAGDAKDNFLTGAGGNDSLRGENGVDGLRGGAGDDILDGGLSPPVLGLRNQLGGDWAYFDDAAGALTINLSAAGPQAVGGGLGSDMLISIENLVGGNFADQLVGDDSANYLGGFGGADTLLGGNSDDVLEGAAGDDRLEGGAGMDVASYLNGATSGVIIDLNIAGPQAVGVGLGADHLISIEGAYGTFFGDKLTGDTQDNYFDGDAGADTILGGAGQDRLLGAGGSDHLNGGSGDDSLTGEAGDDSLTGGIGGDDLRGGAGADSIAGADGADTIEGGSDNDILTGGRGPDLFLFGSGAGKDTLTDFRPGEDDVQFADTFTSFADMLSHTVQVGSHLVITGAGGDVLQLNNLLLSNLQSADFVFA